MRTNSPQFEPSVKPIPLELLKRPDPIFFFDEVMLYEDELADNGIAMLSCKIRVMPARMLLLSRFFMRLDDVIFRIRDTRIYVDFGTGEVIREYVAKEDEFENVRKVCCYLCLLHLRSETNCGCRSLLQLEKTCPP